MYEKKYKKNPEGKQKFDKTQMSVTHGQKSARAKNVKSLKNMGKIEKQQI